MSLHVSRQYTGIFMGENLIWESSHEKHLTILCKKVSGKVSALARMVKVLPFDKKRLLLKTFVESQFSYCPLI